MHECTECGDECDCDQVDLEQPVPADCIHFCDVDDELDDIVEDDAGDE